jgi:hypothetical protein
MKPLLVLAVVLVVVAIALGACQSNYARDPEKYKRDHDRYMDSHVPKTGGPDL